MPKRRKNERHKADVLAPVPVDVLDQFVREGPLTAAEVEAATRRFKRAIIERAPPRGHPPSRRSRIRKRNTILPIPSRGS